VEEDQQVRFWHALSHHMQYIIRLHTTHPAPAKQPERGPGDFSGVGRKVFAFLTCYIGRNDSAAGGAGGLRTTG